jgi:hypothetical protein
MTESKPRITSLQPIVLGDNRRVTLELVVEGLPESFSNIMFMPEVSSSPPDQSPKPDPDAPSPYPNIELSILNSRREQIADLFIVEHKEKDLALTLHLASPDPQEQYIARAEMIYQEQTVDVVEVPFILRQDE